MSTTCQMRAVCGVVLMMWLLGSAEVNSVAAQSFDVSQAQQMVVRILANKRNEIGAGILLKVEDGTGYVLTAYHVIATDVRGDFDVVIETFDGGSFKADATLAAWNKDFDYAVLRVLGMRKAPPYVFLAPSNQLRVTQSVWAVGHPVGGSTWAITEGRITSIQGLNVLLSPGTISAGDSGGPLLNDSGEVLGMITKDVVLQADVLKPIIGLYVRPPSLVLPAASTILSTDDLTSDAGAREVYVAVSAEGRGEVQVFNAEFIQRPPTVIPIGQPLVPGKPLHLAVAPTNGRKGEIYVVDNAGNQVIVLEMGSHAELARIPVGKGPRWIAVTPDQHKAYVSNEQPVGRGTISVINLKTRQVIKTIDRVNCPESLAMSPDGSRVYAVSQCGGGLDPLFVIDTASDTVVKSVPDLAVGLEVAITRDGKKLYVARGGFTTVDRSSGKPVQVPAQLSIVSTESGKVLKNVPMSIATLAVTLDGKYVLIATGKQIDIMETVSDNIVKTIPLGTPPTGIAVTNGGVVYVWLPDEKRVFITGLSGLVSSPNVKDAK